MSAPAFAKGDTVFSVDGLAAEYVMEHDGGHIVVPMYRNDSDDDEPFGAGPWPGEPVVWREVFAKAPVPVVDQEVASARAELERLTSEVNARRNQLRELQAGDRERLARLKEHRQLARIDDWLAGKVTHFVIWQHYGRKVEVQTTADVMGNETRKDYMPLIVLNGTLEWVESYARMGIDWCIATRGSSNTIRCIPCGSEEEARERAAESLEALANDWRRERRNRPNAGYDNELEDMVKSLRKLDLPVAADMEAAYSVSRQAGATTILTLARKRATEARQELTKAEADARAAGVDIEGGVDHG